MKPKYPHITVKLVGEDSNAYYILGKITQAMRRAGVPKEEAAAFMSEATAGDYDHLLQTAMKYVEVT